MKAQVTVLENGIRVVSENVADMPSVSIGLWAAAGSRAEGDHERGIAHVLEHMAFKGTTSRSARMIAEEIENVGGDINAGTSLEHTSYYARVLADNLGLATEILGDILTDSIISKDELECEKAVIIQEINALQDSPEELIFDLLQEAAFPDQPLGKPITGTADSVNAITRENILNFLAKNYHGSRCVIAAAGAVDHEILVSHANKYFSKLSSGSGMLPKPAQFRGRYKILARDTSQVQVAFGFSGTSYQHQDLYIAHLFAHILGGGMASRLFQEVRERRGLCYTVSAFNWAFSDTGLFALHAATGPELVSELVPVMLDVLRGAAGTAEAHELERAKAQFKAGMLMALESTVARAEHLARMLLIYGRLVPTDEFVQRIENVTLEQIHLYAAGMLESGQAAFAAIGPAAALPDEAELQDWGLPL